MSVTTALIYLVVMLLVAAVVFLIASYVFGRGEELAPLPPGASPTRLPAADVTSDDVRGLRFQQALRGYKMSEVDWVLDRLGAELDLLRARVAELEDQPAGPASSDAAEDAPEDAPAEDVVEETEAGEPVSAERGGSA